MVPSEDRYHRLWRSIYNVLTHQGLKISRVAKAGSRAKQQYRPDSDMDIIFAVVGDPSKREFYPKLIKVMNDNFRTEHVYPGDSYNVVHIDFIRGGKFVLVLLTEKEFDNQHGQNIEYRRDNL
ncbi:MAG: hypothetical protein GF311_26555 [Candidatus Lokiarchaeota archaeon]|nr:hypothetical protein [Candidatus Lokiarchaeota archaeon]